MAYFSGYLVSRICLHSVGRQSQRSFSYLCESADCFFTYRILAWRQLYLPAVGNLSWIFLCGGADGIREMAFKAQSPRVVLQSFGCRHWFCFFPRQQFPVIKGNVAADVRANDPADRSGVYMGACIAPFSDSLVFGNNRGRTFAAERS